MEGGQEKVIYIGIDPGLYGAVAALDADGRVLSLQDTPVLAVKKGQKTRHVYVESQMAALISALCQQHANYPTTCVALENVHAMPGQGVVSMFGLGVGLGIWRGIIAARRLRVTLVEPAVWKRAMGVAAGADKGASVVRALQLFPSAAGQLDRKKDHGRADALLLAEYLRQRTPKDQPNLASRES